VASRREVDETRRVEGIETGGRQRAYVPPRPPSENTTLDVTAAKPGDVVTSGADEQEVFSISPTMLLVKGGYGLAAIGAVLLVGLTSVLVPKYVPVWLSVLIGLLLFLV